jgi:hypothetical protein
VTLPSVGLAAVAGGQHPSPAGQFRRHVQSFDAVGGEPVVQRRAESGGAFDDLGRLREAACEALQGSAAVMIDNWDPCAVTSMLAITGTSRAGISRYLAAWPHLEPSSVVAVLVIAAGFVVCPALAARTAARSCVAPARLDLRLPTPSGLDLRQLRWIRLSCPVEPYLATVMRIGPPRHI